MKRLILIGLSVFILLFLLWPSTKYGDSCSDLGIDFTHNLTEERDCAPPQVFNKIGGGLEYIYKIASDKAAGITPGSSSSSYKAIDDHFFAPSEAIRNAFAISLVIVIVLYMAGRLKSKTNHK